MSVNSHPGARFEARKQPAQRRSHHTVDRILDAAAHVFAERGYTATTTNHVATEAGVSIGSLYQYFPNKDALLGALEERHLRSAKIAVDTLTSDWRTTAPDGHALATSLIQCLVAVNASPLHVLIYDTAPALPHVGVLTAGVVDDLIAELAFHLRRWGQRRGVKLRAHITAVTALRLVHDVAIRLPPGRRRQIACREIVRTISLALAADQP